MNRKLVLFALVLSTVAAGGQQQPAIDHNPASCLPAGEMPVLQMRIDGDGEVRAYFRRTGASDWCSVEAENRGALTSATLPKFDEGIEIEYFFLMREGERVIARSPMLYRAKFTSRCNTIPVARHIRLLTLDCGKNGRNAVPAAVGAGFALAESLVATRFEVPTPDSPTATNGQ